MPLNIDSNSVLFTILVFGTILTLFSWTLVAWKGAPAWYGYWAPGNTCILVGSSLLLSQGHWHPLFSVVGANGILFLGYLLIEQGLRVFCGLRSRLSLVGLLWGADMVLLVLFTLGIDMFLVRVVLQSGLIVLVFATILRHLWIRIPLERLEHAILVNSFLAIFILMIGFNATRAVVAFWEPTTTVLARSNGVILLLFANLIGMLAWTLGFTALSLFRDQRLLASTISARDKMYALIAHDLRGPIGAVATLLELLQNDGEGDADDALHVAARSARAGSELTENLLRWASAQSHAIQLNRSDFALETLIDLGIAPLELTAASKEIRINVHRDPGIHVWVDEVTMVTVFRNLVSNALKFTPKGGSITVDASRLGDRVEVRVTDSGIGLPEGFIDEWQRGLLPKSTRGTGGESGSGLGLPLCREFVLQNGGEMSFSTGNFGTQVRVLLPSPERARVRGI